VGLEKPLEKKVFEDVEELLSSRVSSEETLNHLLVAPLADSSSALVPAKSSLSYGLSAVASILEELSDLQPLIRRFTDLWLGLPETIFNHFTESKKMIWLTVVEKCSMNLLLKVDNIDNFIAHWNLLAFHFTTQQSRSGVNALALELSQRLFPHEKQVEMMSDTMLEEVEHTHSEGEERRVINYEAFTRVEKQIAAIAQAISEGRDEKAGKFLRELIQDQTLSPGGESYAVKSLCNIAQQCADMFRMDFEANCLMEALRLNPSDAWTLIQQGDHLKRVGKYKEALKVFAQARKLGDNEVGKSSEADVYAQQGNYAKAIKIYETILNWKDDPKVLNAIASNLRKMWRMEEAQVIYERLANPALHGLLDNANDIARAQAGIAEILKRQGKLDAALQIYYGIIAQKYIDNRDMLFHKLGLCNILKLMGKFKDAYKIVDEVIQEFPFAMMARFIRGSILGLIGRELEGLKDLPESSGSRSFQEWSRRYYRGLLLLKLERYDDAKKDLVDELPKAIAFGEEKAILRMAAALWFLGRGNTSDADELLSEIPNLKDGNTQYLSLVLKLHSATQDKNIARMDSLMEQISEFQVVDASLKDAVVALRKRNFTLAIACETDYLLKLAA